MDKKIKKVLKKELKGITLLLAVLFLIIGGVLGYIVYDLSNQEGFTKIQLNGEETVIIEIGSTYEELGCTLVIDDVDCSNDVVINGKVDTNQEGVYVLTYNYEKDGTKVQLTRVVSVRGGVSNE